MSADYLPDATWSAAIDGDLAVTGTEDPASPVLADFFAGYDRAFVLPDEREELEGFRECLAANRGAPLRFGRRHRELVIVLRDAAGGAALGGANFLATDMGARPRQPHVSVALNYLYVDQQVRGRGLARKLVAAVAQLAQRAAGRPEDEMPAIFIEQNDPFRLTADEYAADTAHSGLDQVDRLAIWARLGARAVDFPYVQPALSASQGSDDGLLYAALAYPGDAVPAAFLHDHLQSFFGVSVLKGGDPAAEPVAGAQLAELAELARAGKDVALLDLMAPLARLERGKPLPPARSMLAFAKQA
ncbi:GNAT family N-acetyltransferase [Sphingomonas sp.]|uniref:GNAT family N-acetyltransferase n=1 Tax=Sphingomonas sp. TaxID=28214 RepID=UPI0031E3B655